MRGINPIEIVLRIGVFGTFLAHGILTFDLPEKWLGYITTAGFSDSAAESILPVIGVVDICVAIIVLLKPYKWVVLWAVVWALGTALMRPISGEPILEFVERSANFMLPLALFLYMGKHKQRRTGHHSM
jgi:hypothetical protein